MTPKINKFGKPIVRVTILLALSVSFMFPVNGQIIMNDVPVAFPGAEGHGRFTTGGRGGKVIYVTNLNDSGEGSLRSAIQQSGSRIVLFKVSGIIELQSNLTISNDNITIAGQTAPGDGICLKNYSLAVSADNVIIRYIRSRMGDEAAHEGDAMEGRYHENIIIDHCTMSWSTDECSSFYNNKNFTMQWCLISESLVNSVHVKGNHGYGGIWGGNKASFHHNLLAHHDSRNPRMGGSRYTGIAEDEVVDFRNNVIYNWGNNSGYGGEGGFYNFINNYYKPGVASRSSKRDQIFAPDTDDGTAQNDLGVHAYYHVKGNFMFDSEAVTENNWLGIKPTNDSLTREILEVDELPKGQITTHDAETTFDKVLKYVGCSLKRDSVDMRIVDETLKGEAHFPGRIRNGLINSADDVGGWPTYNTSEVPVDTDSDGMPDDWEVGNSLNPNDATDASDYDLSKFYTNVEVYIHSLVGHITYDQMLGGDKNYQDLAYELQNASITISDGSQIPDSVAQGVGMKEIIFPFENALSAVAGGLPEGVDFRIDWEDQALVLYGTPMHTGDFKITVSTYGSSQDVSTKIDLHVYRFTPLSLQGNNHLVRVFPNPLAAGQVINFSLNKTEQVKRIILSDISGKRIRSWREAGISNMTIPAEIESGVYTLIIDTNQRSGSQRLLITDH